mmetsp:Transcript_552/g.1090  ORF Transcript_552/g.1090 Transcript_552/m.1090 type:complete len:144 (+) Transcript_552:1454-1885(+)
MDLSSLTLPKKFRRSCTAFASLFAVSGIIASVSAATLTLKSDKKGQCDHTRSMLSKDDYSLTHCRIRAGSQPSMFRSSATLSRFFRNSSVYPASSRMALQRCSIRGPRSQNCHAHRATKKFYHVPVDHADLDVQYSQVRRRRH